jgi:biliverdin reductase / flavin reductase
VAAFSIFLEKGVMNMKIAVFGASGGTGQEFIGQALKNHHNITAIVRNPDALNLQNSRLRKVVGDALRPETLRDVFKGKDAVVSTLGISSFWKSLRPMTFHRQSINNIISEMNRAGVSRLLCMTSTGVIHNPTAPLFYNLLIQPLLKNKYEDMQHMEGEVERSDLTWTILRPFRLTNAARTGIYRIATNGKLDNAGSISRADVADLLLRSLEGDLHIRQTVAVAY